MSKNSKAKPDIQVTALMRVGFRADDSYFENRNEAQRSGLVDGNVHYFRHANHLNY
jgi:hypothetical protein